MFSHSNDCNVQNSAHTTFIHAALIIFLKSLSFRAQREHVSQVIHSVQIIHRMLE